MQHLGWGLIVIGVLIAVRGLVWLSSPSIPWLGTLPSTWLVFVKSFGARP